MNPDSNRNLAAVKTQEVGQDRVTQLSLANVQSQVSLIQQVMTSVMHDKEHYGTIPGCGPKPTLLKAGAEKLLLTFRLAPEYEELPGSKEEADFICYKIRCKLMHITTGEFVGSGLGTCNSREKKYKNSSPWDVQNTLCKMACKRALVAAVLNATAASDIFTQDIEDMVIDGAPKTEKSAPQSAQSTPQPATSGPEFCEFGKNKGTRWDAMNDGQLKWYRDVFEQSVKDPEKAKFKSKNEELLLTVAGILLKRAGKPAPGVEVHTIAGLSSEGAMS